MIHAHGISLRGKAHISSGLPCQDAHCIAFLDDGWVVAAIADGVGSMKNAELGARIAAETVVNFCKDFMPYDRNVINLKSMLRTAYNYALTRIVKVAEQQEVDFDSFDTTLTTVIYDGRRIVYGHAGDGAIIGLNEFGSYVPITTPQKGEDNVSVVPLRAGFTSWVIDSYEEDLSGVLMVTDGILDIVKPYLIKELNQGVYVPLSMFLLDPNCFDYQKCSPPAAPDAYAAFAEGNLAAEYYFQIMEKALGRYFSDPAVVGRVIESIRRTNFPLRMMESVTDDKTIVAIMNLDNPPDAKEAEYYLEPDWAVYQDAWKRLVYPHLYAEETTAIKSGEPEPAAAQPAPAQPAPAQPAPAETSTTAAAEEGFPLAPTVSPPAGKPPASQGEIIEPPPFVSGGKKDTPPPRRDKQTISPELEQLRHGGLKKPGKPLKSKKDKS